MLQVGLPIHARNSHVIQVLQSCDYHVVMFVVRCRCLHPDKGMLDTCEIYYRLKESVAKYELIVLRVVKFELKHDLPHKVIQWVEPLN